VHDLIHLYALSKDVRRREKLRRDTQSFSRLLREKDENLTKKENARQPYLDIPSIHKDCQSEIARWEKCWNATKGEWILDTVRSTLSPVPPTDFFSRSYDEAFKEYNPDKSRCPSNIIQQTSLGTEKSIVHLRDMQISLNEEIKRLEVEVNSATPRKASVRKSMPPPPSSNPSTPSPLQSKRSVSRIGRSVSEEPQSRAVPNDLTKRKTSNR
jgi:hypothetical protein